MTPATVPWDRVATELVEDRGDDLPEPRWSLPASTGLVAAVALAIMGFGLLGYRWWQISAFTVFAKQLPHFGSGGLTGLGLIVPFAALLLVVIRRPDELEQREQGRALIAALQALAARENEENR